MRARSVVAGLAAAGALVVGGAGSASANILWCMDDPPVQVQTPSGANLTVNVTVAVPQHYAKYINNVTVHTATASDGAGGTLITLDVAVPATIPQAKISVSVNKFKVTDSAAAPGGATTTLQLDVPAA